MSEPTTGGIVLCGGRSSRMGLPKATLPFGPELMVQRVTRILGQVVSPIVVVAAPGQDLPPLPEGISIVRDRREGRGPLEGLAAGLAALHGRADAAYATSCDVPLLVPDFVRRVVACLGEHDVAVPLVDGYHHTLAAVYRVGVLTHIEALLAEDRLRPFFLYQRVRTRELLPADLADVDPHRLSLLNLNNPDEYIAALARAGLPPPTSELLAALRKEHSPRE
jgi:molybdopterin-guanine dinucleotide biosynthesis protein A